MERFKIHEEPNAPRTRPIRTLCDYVGRCRQFSLLRDFEYQAEMIDDCVQLLPSVIQFINCIWRQFTQKKKSIVWYKKKAKLLGYCG